MVSLVYEVNIAQESAAEEYYRAWMLYNNKLTDIMTCDMLQIIVFHCNENMMKIPASKGKHNSDKNIYIVINTRIDEWVKSEEWRVKSEESKSPVSY